jgi:hypothetical protein
MRNVDPLDLLETMREGLLVTNCLHGDIAVFKNFVISLSSRKLGYE